MDRYFALIGKAVFLGVAIVAAFVASPVSADTISPPPPPISEATSESAPMIYSSEGSPNAIEGAPNTPASPAAAAGFPVDGFTGPMPFNIGYVQHRPYVHAIFWGSEWNSYPGTREKIIGLFQWLNGSSYANILTQYFDRSGYISNQTDLTSFTDTRVVRPPQASPGDVRAEIDWAIQNRSGWQTSFDNQYIVFAPPGTPVAPGACGYHGWSGQYAFAYIPWSPPECRRELEPWGAMQVTASHEWAEMATDPIPLVDYYGWTITEIQGEIADLCNTGNAAEHGEAAPGIFVAKLADDYLWSANNTPCVIQDAAPIKYQINTGGTSVGIHNATLTGSVTPGGWPAFYQFVFSGPGGTTYTPPRVLNGPIQKYGFAPIGQGFGNVPVSAQVGNLKGNTTYNVRLESLSALTEPKVISEYGNIQIFSGGDAQFTTPDWRPAISLVAAVNVKGHSATLQAAVNPLGEGTTYQFEFGTSTSYGAVVPIPAQGIGTGTSPVAIQNDIAGLEEATVYHYRVSATNGEGTSYSGDREFRTPGKPVVTTSPVLYVNTLEPELAATVNPNGAATTYQFEYGLTSSYDTKIPVSPESIGGEVKVLSVGQYLSTLQRNTMYHYRITAENEVGKSVGKDQSFTTLPPCKGPEGKCTWSSTQMVDPPLVTEDELNDVSCGSSSLCVATGRNKYKKAGLVELWKSKAWSIISEPAGDTRGVSCASAKSCVAVGATANGTAQSWMIGEISGGFGILTSIAPPVPAGATASRLSDVSCPIGGSVCIGVGYYRDAQGAERPLSVRWDGTSWANLNVPYSSSEQGSGEKAMLSISCYSSTSCMAVGEVAGRPAWASFSSNWNEPGGFLPTGALGGKFASVSCTFSNFCMAVGSVTYEKASNEKPYAVRFTGGAGIPTTVPMPSGAQGFVNLTGVSCREPIDCKAVGYYAPKLSGGFFEELKPFALSWQGETLSKASWTLKTVQPSGESKYSVLQGMSCFLSSPCVAVGAEAIGLFYETSLTVAHEWNGPVWKSIPPKNPDPQTEDEIKDVSCINASLCFAVGRNVSKGNSFMEKWNGSDWTLEQSAAGEIKHLSCTASGCVAVGNTGIGAPQSWLITQIQSQWVLVPAPALPMPAGMIDGTLSGVSCPGAVCLAVGSYRDQSGYKPLVERWNGSEWSLQTAPGPAEGNAQNAMLSVSCSSSIDCITVGEAAGKPVAERWDGSAWGLTSVPSPPGSTGAKLLSVSCVPGLVVNPCVAVGSGWDKTSNEAPLVETWDGAGWAISASPKPADSQGWANLTSVNCLSPRSCSAAGYYASKVEGGGAPVEVKPLKESLTGTTWGVEALPALVGFTFGALQGISCTSAINCVAAGLRTPAPFARPILTLSARYQ
jgi:hypothetical protein